MLKSYSSCMVRTPLYPVRNIREVDINKILDDKVFMEAVRIASPILYKEVYVKKNRSRHSIGSILKYYSRACVRCTPYGLFASCSLVPVDESKKNSSIKLCDVSEYETYTRIDMNLLCNLIRDYESDPILKQKLFYHVNSSLYSSWKSYRYICYSLNGNKRRYMFSEIRKSQYLRRLLQRIGDSEIAFNDIVEFVEKSENVKHSEALEYSLSLIDNQILVSNLEPSVAGKDLIYQIKEEMDRVDVDTSFLDQIISRLRKIDNEVVGNRKQNLDELLKILKFQDFKSDSENPIQMDCFARLSEGYIGSNIVKQVEKGVTFLINMTRKNRKFDLELFRQKFYSYYEEQEVPLAIALDTQIGVGYGQWNDINGDINPILYGVPAAGPKNNSYGVSLKESVDFLTQILLDKFNECLINKSNVIDLTDVVREQCDEITGNIPNQIFAFISVIANHKEPLINLVGIGTGTCSKLISRFEYLNKDIKDFVNEITAEEQREEKGIVAEILHLPEDRVGNIQMHPANRKYSICYFSNPVSNNVTLNIPVSDIMISVPRGEKIILRSKKYNKVIKPILSTAHNFYYGLPIYRFLSDLQAEANDDFVFDWGAFFDLKPFLPRVQYSNIILSPARWLVSIENFPEFKNDKAKDLELLRSGFIEKNIPTEFMIADGDNKLYINIDDSQLANILLDELKRKKNLRLEEFLGSDSRNGLIKRKGEILNNEIIMCFHKNNSSAV